MKNEKHNAFSELAKLKEHKYYLEEKLKTEVKVNEESRSYLESYQQKLKEEFCLKEEELKKEHNTLLVAMK